MLRLQRKNGFGGINARHAVLSSDCKKFITNEEDGFTNCGIKNVQIKLEMKLQRQLGGLPFKNMLSFQVLIIYLSTCNFKSHANYS
jgi:hypothetical protein